MSKDKPLSDVEISLKELLREAINVGLLPEGSTLTLERGSRVNGIAPRVSIDGARYGTPDFLPRFTHLTTKRELRAALDGARYALFAVNYKRRYG